MMNTIFLAMAMTLNSMLLGLVALVWVICSVYTIGALKTIIQSIRSDPKSLRAVAKDKDVWWCCLNWLVCTASAAWLLREVF